jgi:hypothetical protein
MPQTTDHSLLSLPQDQFESCIYEELFVRQSKQVDDLGFQVFKAATMNNAVFWNVDVSEQTCRLHLQGRITRARKSVRRKLTD